MNNDNSTSVPMVQIPESQIVMTEKGADIVTVKDTGISDSNTVLDQKAERLERPANPTPTNDELDITSNELKSLADKAAICIMRRIQIALDAQDWPLLDRLMAHMPKLVDAQMAMTWAIKWQNAILSKPQNLSSLKPTGTLTAINQGRAVKARKQEKGDQRTTPKRLLKDLPIDDVA